MALLGDKIVDKLLDYAVAGATLVGGMIFQGLLGTQVLQDPFYHPGWLQENKAWLIVFLILWVVSTCLALRFWGLVFVTVLALASAVVFALFYNGSSSLSENWQLAIWIDHGVAYSMVPVIITGWIVVGLKWTGVL